MDLPTYARKTGTRPAQFQARLAEHGLEVSAEIVRRWLLGTQAPGVKSVAAIEAATGGKVKRAALRPDVFGRPQ
jgi:DNA-binding transcriptional regulator YdaS (Cro superfamily)